LVEEELGIRGDGLQILRIFDASISKIRISNGIRMPLLLVTFICRLRITKESLGLVMSMHRISGRCRRG